jgi:predicted CoA-binding protein
VTGVLDETTIPPLLAGATTVALVGASTNPAFHSHRVATYLVEAGYAVYPVLPAGGQVGGVPAVASLDDVPAPVDIVYGFVRPSAAPEVARAAVAAGAGALWLDEGIVSAEAEAIATAAGLACVTNRSMEIEHRVGIRGERRVHFIPM